MDIRRARISPSREPVKEIRGEVHHISLVGDRYLLVLDRNKLPLPPLYTRYFMWGFPDRSARVALVEGDKVLSVFENLHQGRILCSAMGGENLLLTGGDSTIVCVWEMKNVGLKGRSPVQLQLKHTLHGHTDAVTCIAASAAFNIIVSGSKDQTCIIWDTNKMVFVRQLREHTGTVTMAVINQSNGSIVSCTKNQICLWTVNGTLLATANILITGNFKLMCCAVSEMFDWDQDNVIITGSSDGIVRMWVLEYVRMGEILQSPVKKKGPEKKVEVTETEGEPLLQDPTVVAEGMSTDSEEDIYTTPPAPTPTPATTPLEGKEEDNPVYHDSNDTTQAPVHITVEGTNGSPDPIEDTSSERPIDAVSSILAVKGTNKERASSMRETHTSVEGDGITEPDGSLLRQRSVSQPDEHNLKSSVMKKATEVMDFLVATASGALKQAIDIPPKTQIGGSDNGGCGEEGREENGSEALPMSPVLAEYIADARKKVEELRDKTGQWTRRLTEIHQLTMHTAVSRKDNDTPAAVTSIHISRDHRRLFVGDSRGRVFSWTVSDNLGGVMEHWLRDEAVDKCMKCGVEFSFTERKHHCRDCGKIFCYRCSAFESEVERLRIMKKVRVCEECYKNLRPTNH